MEPSSAPWRLLETPEPEAPAPEPDPRDIPWPAVGVMIVAAAIALGAALLATRPQPDVSVDGATAVGSASAAMAGTPTTSPSGMGGDLVVEVGGAVARPGVYHLRAGSRVGDAIEAAGGYGPGVDAVAADLRLNLAALVRDGDEIHVPTREEAATTPGQGGAGAGTGTPAGLIDLNSATAEQLDTLPGVGPATAAKIIAARDERRFASVDDLQARKIVGTTTLEKIRPLATAGP